MNLHEQERLKRDADDALHRIEELCKKAFRDGYTKGFEAGVAVTLGAVPKDSEKGDPV